MTVAARIVARPLMAWAAPLKDVGLLGVALWSRRESLGASAPVVG